MKIGHKIVLGYAIIALLFVTAGGMQMAHILRMRAQIDQLILHNVNEMAASRAALVAIKEAHARIHTMLSIPRGKPDPEQGVAESNDIKRIMSNIDSAMSSLESTVRKQFERSHSRHEEMELRTVRSMRQRMQVFFTQANRIAAQAASGTLAYAGGISEAKIDVPLLGVQSKVDFFEKGAQREISSNLLWARTVTDSDIRQSMLLVVAALLGMIAMGWLISRNISTKVGALRAATSRLGEGKLDTRVDIDGRDEISDIATAVNQMAEGLRKAIVSRDDMAREVRQREKVESLLRSQQTLTHIYLDTADVMLGALDANGMVRLINRKGCEILGYAEHDIINRNWFETCIPPGIRKQTEEVFAQLMAGEGKAAKHHENAVLSRNGERKLIAFHNTILKQNGRILGVFFSGEDITSHKQAERALQNSEEQIRLLLDSTKEAIFGIDTEGNCTLVNAACLNTLGYNDAGELIGRNMHDATHYAHPDGSPHAKQDCKICQAFRNDTSVHVDGEVFWRKDGSSFPVSCWAHPIRKDDAIIGSVVTFADISEKIMARNALLESYGKLDAALEGTVQAIVTAMGARDPYTAAHQMRVARLSVAIGRELGLEESRIKGIHMGATIHDIGKIQVPAELLSRPSRLNETEYSLIKGHAQAGYDILKNIDFPWPVADIAHQHHEHIDGSGYPQGLKGDAICLEARIVAVADVVEAVSSHRPYRPALGIDKALEEIRAKRGVHYDPQVVDACLRLFSERSFHFTDD